MAVEQTETSIDVSVCVSRGGGWWERAGVRVCVCVCVYVFVCVCVIEDRDER
jgi:hypothetical protein